MAYITKLVYAATRTFANMNHRPFVDGEAESERPMRSVRR